MNWLLSGRAMPVIGDNESTDMSALGSISRRSRPNGAVSSSHTAFIPSQDLEDTGQLQQLPARPRERLSRRISREYAIFEDSDEDADYVDAQEYLHSASRSSTFGSEGEAYETNAHSQHHLSSQRIQRSLSFAPGQDELTLHLDVPTSSRQPRVRQALN